MNTAENRSQRGSTTDPQNYSDSPWPTTTLNLERCILPRGYINILFVFVPLGLASGVIPWASAFVFVFNLLAILPVAKLFTFTLRKLLDNLNPFLRGVLRALFGNTVMLIVSTTALRHDHTRMAQLSMLGSILANALLVVGCCFLTAGIRHEESIINTAFASTASSMMSVASISLVIPAALSGTQCKADSSCEESVIFLSRGISVVLLVLLAVYLNFRHNSHLDLFTGDLPECGRRQEGTEHNSFAVTEAAVLLLCMFFVSINARLIMRTTNAITESSFVSERFIGFIVLPLVVEGPDRFDAVRAAYNDKMDQALDFAIGRSMQTALFSTPFLVLIGWAMRIREPMTFHFQSFETVALFLSTQLVSNLIGNGKSNYLEGAICLATYLNIALALQFLPH